MEQGKQIFQLIPAIMKSVGCIGKERQNRQQGYTFRGIDDVYNAMHGPLSENGVFIVPEVLEQHREERQTQKGGLLLYTILKVKHTFYAPDGSNVVSVTVGEAMDSGDKSANKAMSAAMKYALIEVFAIPTEGDNDTENGSPQPTAKNAAGASNGQPQKQPAKPKGRDLSKEPIGEDRAAQAAHAIDEAFKARSIDVENADFILNKALESVKVAELGQASEAFLMTFIKNIQAGKYDKVRAPAGAMANA